MWVNNTSRGTSSVLGRLANSSESRSVEASFTTKVVTSSEMPSAYTEVVSATTTPHLGQAASTDTTQTPAINCNCSEDKCFVCCNQRCSVWETFSKFSSQSEKYASQNQIPYWGSVNSSKIGSTESLSSTADSLLNERAIKAQQIAAVRKQTARLTSKTLQRSFGIVPDYLSCSDWLNLGQPRGCPWNSNSGTIGT